MLKKLFNLGAAPVYVDFNEIRDRLDLDGSCYQPDPDEHIQILDFLGKYTLRGSSHYGPAKTFYVDPNKFVTLITPPAEFSGETDPSISQYRSSACASYTEDGAPFGKKAFAMIIRVEANNAKELNESVVFGLYGIVDKQGRMKITKIMAPGKDEHNRMTPLKSIKVTPENAQLAMRYAELCIYTMQQEGPFFARQCLEQAMKEDMAQTGMTLLGPKP